MILFFEVSSLQAKKECIVGLAYQYFLLNQRLQFFVEDETAGKFLDQLLWAFPGTSFLPHTLEIIPKLERIAIFSKNSWKEATVTFNLKSRPADDPFVIELMDKTDPNKEQRSNEKLAYYKEKGRPILCYTWGRPLNPTDLIPQAANPAG